MSAAQSGSKRLEQGGLVLFQLDKLTPCELWFEKWMASAQESRRRALKRAAADGIARYRGRRRSRALGVAGVPVRR